MPSKYSAQLQKTVKAPFSGIEFSIRRISFGEYMNDLGIMPIQSTPGVQAGLAEMNEEFKQKAAADPVFAARAVKFILKSGVASPKIFFGDGDCPEEEVPFDDLAPDTSFLIAQISEFSSKPLGLENFFFGDQPGNTGPGGEALRPATVEPPSEGNHSPKPGS